MRITESQLRKIIRQEVRRLTEYGPGTPWNPTNPPENLIPLEELIEMMEAVPATDIDGGVDQALMNLNDYSGYVVDGAGEPLVIVSFDCAPDGECVVYFDGHDTAYTTLDLEQMAGENY